MTTALEKQLADALRLGRDMRRAQTEYFKTKDRTILVRSIDLEKRYDTATDVALEAFTRGEEIGR